MKKWMIIVGVFLAAMAVTGFMYSQGAEIIDDDVMYMVSHSEYWSGEEGQIIARLYNWQGNPITVDNCTVDIYYPDKTLFITGGVTDDSLQAATGTHWYNFTTPAIEGVYQYYATCNYNGNSRTVANSFHLSPALNFQLDINNSITTLTAQELAHYIAIDDNLTTLRTELGVVDVNVDELLTRTLDINTTVNGLGSNLDEILVRTGDINTTVNGLVTDVANVQVDTTYIRNNMFTTDNVSLITDGQTDILNNITAVQNFCDSAETSGSQLCLWVDQIQQQVADINASTGSNDAILAEINSTTHSTYDYMTGTLTTTVNNIFGVNQQINATVNRIEETTLQINSSITGITDNQESVVYMEVTS